MTAMTPHEIQNKPFEKKGMGGYKAEDVRAYLTEVAAYIRVLLSEKNELEEKMAVLAEKLEEYREDEDSLRAALIGAQKLGDSVVRDAKKKAELMLAEASAKAESLVNDAKSNIDREALALTRIQGQVTEFKAQLLNLYKRHIEMIQAIPDEQELPSVVKEIVQQAAAEIPAEPVHDKAGKIENFVISYEELEDDESEEDAGQESGGPRRRSNFNDLRFGEEYNLTRND